MERHDVTFALLLPRTCDNKHTSRLELRLVQTFSALTTGLGSIIHDVFIRHKSVTDILLD